MCRWSMRDLTQRVCTICGRTKSATWNRSFCEGKLICSTCYYRLRRQALPELREKMKRDRLKRIEKDPYAHFVSVAAHPVEIDRQEYSWLMSQNCFYCGDTVANKIGARLDRLDSSKAYTFDNVVTCCRECNVAKTNRSLERFTQWIDAVHSNLKRNSNRLRSIMNRT